MATYTVTGHPLNYSDLAIPEADLVMVKGALQANGVGATISLTLSGTADTKVKGHGVLK
jgi:hypothetical protein